MKTIILLAAFICCAVPLFAQTPPPVGSCSGPSQVGNTATTQNAGGTSSSTYICAAVGQGPVRYVWQIVPPAPTIPLQNPVIPPYAGTTSPLNQPCIANAQVTYNATIYTCGGGGTPNVYGIAPAGAASSVPIGGVTGYAGGDSTNTLTALVNDQMSGASQYNPVLVGLSPTASAATNCSALQSAINTAHANGGGIVLLPAGVFNMGLTTGTCAILSYPEISIRGATHGGTIINNATATGIWLLWTLTALNVTDAGTVEDIRIEGNPSSTTAVGIAGGGMIGATMRNVVIVSYEGDCLQLNNGYYSGVPTYTERFNIDHLTTAYCGNGLHFQTLNGDTNSSFGHSRMNIRCNTDLGQACVRLDNNTSVLYDGELRIDGNFSNNNSGTGNVIAFANSGNVYNEYLLITGESGSAGGSPTFCSTYRYAGSGLVSYAPAPAINNSVSCNDGTNTASFYATYRFAASPLSLDTGTFGFGGLSGASYALPTTITATPENYTLNPLGFGELGGSNLESPYAAVLASAGNYFSVCSVASGSALNTMSCNFTVDPGGTIAGKGFVRSTGTNSINTLRGPGTELYYNSNSGTDTNGGIRVIDETSQTDLPLVIGANNAWIDPSHRMCVNCTATPSSGATLQVNGSIAPNQTQALVNGSTSGACAFGEPFAGTPMKMVVIYCNAVTGTASYTFPQAFSNTPLVMTSNGLAASVVTSVSTTAVTVTGASTTGTLILMGY